jgi:hypothetical protein
MDSRTPQTGGSRVLLTPLVAPWGIAMQRFLRELLYKFCVDPPSLSDPAEPRWTDRSSGVSASPVSSSSFRFSASFSAAHLPSENGEHAVDTSTLEMTTRRPKYGPARVCPRCLQSSGRESGGKPAGGVGRAPPGARLHDRLQQLAILRLRQFRAVQTDCSAIPHHSKLH